MKRSFPPKHVDHATPPQNWLANVSLVIGIVSVIIAAGSMMKISSQNEQITQLKDKIQSFEDMPKSTPSASNSHQESGFNLSKQDQVAISEWVGAWTKSSMEAKFTELHGGSGGSIPNFYYFYQRNKLGISDPPKYP